MDVRLRVVLAAALLCGALPDATPRDARAAGGTATIVGRLIKDYVKPGSAAAKDAGIAGATIEVVATTWPTTALPPITEPVAPAIATVTGAADGTFRIDGLPAGRLGLVVRAPGIATTLFRGFRTTDGATLHAMELVCRNPPQEFASRLVRKDGGPVGGLEIVTWCTDPMEPNFGRREVVRTKTAADGSFRITGAAWFCDSVVVLGPNGYSDLDVRRRHNSPHETTEIGGDATLDLLVTDPAGRPIPGARVRLLAEGLLEGRTQDTGRCVFPGLKPGGFVVIADAPGFASVPMAGFGPSLWSETPPDRKPLASGRNERTIVAHRTGKVTGVVADKAGGTPVAGARVRYATLMSIVFGAPETTTDAAGKFTLRDVPLGGGVVVADKEWWRQAEIWKDAPWEFLAACASGSRKDGDAVPSPAVFLAADGAAADVRVALDRYAPLAVELRDVAGKPVAGASVVVFTPQRDGGAPSATNRHTYAAFLGDWSESYADDAGHASVDVLPEPSEIVVEAPGFPPTQEKFDPAAPRPPGPKIVVLHRKSSLEVRVVDAAGRPIPGASIWFRELDNPFARRGDVTDSEVAMYLQKDEPSKADASGKFVGTFRPGSVLVVAGRAGMLGTKVVRAPVAEGGSAPFEVKLAPSGSIEGRVELDGKPAANARVHVVERLPEPKSGETAPDPKEADVEVRPDGRFHVDCLAAGPVLLIAYVPKSLESDIVELDVRPGSPTTIASPLTLHEPR